MECKGKSHSLSEAGVWLNVRKVLKGRTMPQESLGRCHSFLLTLALRYRGKIVCNTSHFTEGSGGLGSWLT